MSVTWGQFNDYLIHNAKLKNQPLVGQFELTARCNLACKMCYVRYNRNDTFAMNNERSAKEWIQLAWEAREAGTLYLLLTGGEVFLRNDFKTIYEEISSMGFVITIYTNGTLISHEMANWLGKRPPSQVEVTLYGASKQTYQQLCGDARGYERAIAGIDSLIAEGMNVQIKTTVVKSNKDDFNKLTMLADERNINFGMVSYISQRRDGCSNNLDSERLLPKEVALYELNFHKHYYDKYKKKDENNYSHEKNDMNYKVVKERDNNFNCGVGNYTYWITWDGKMIPCGLLDNPQTYPFEQGLLNAWNDLRKSIAYIPSCIVCTNCTIKRTCLSCPARLANETGDWTTPSDYLCELSRERIKLKQG